ncbi:MAG: nuclear transport factor 2 family protein [Pseudomonadales bacterium]|nr:nuclear transport factor 2 family protein [Pseudomonadales bacterium]
MDRKVIEQRLADYLESYRQEDKQAWLSLFSDNVVFEDPVGKPEIVGIQAMSDFWDKGHNGMLTLEPTPAKRMIVCGNEAILVFTMKVRMQDGSGFNIHPVDHFVFDESGKVSRLRAFWDEPGVEAVQAG